MIGLLSLVAATAMATTIVVQQSDEVIGYDGDCQVYFRPDLGYFEVCPSMEPVVLGVSFDTLQFRHGFHFREGFTRERVNSMTVNKTTNVNRDVNVNRSETMRPEKMHRNDREMKANPKPGRP
jgi:hypothetical protein